MVSQLFQNGNGLGNWCNDDPRGWDTPAPMILKCCSTQFAPYDETIGSRFREVAATLKLHNFTYPHSRQKGALDVACSNQHVFLVMQGVWREAIPPGLRSRRMAGNGRIHPTNFQTYRFHCPFHDGSQEAVSDFTHASHTLDERTVDPMQYRRWSLMMVLIACLAYGKATSRSTTSGKPRF